MILFTSDTHFGHAAIIGYCKRPFASLEDMDRTMIQNWNAIVDPDDTVYHLGDFAMGRFEAAAAYRKALNGRIVLVLGNHDRSAKRMRELGFDEVCSSATIDVDGIGLHLSHKPPKMDACKALDADYVLHGHVHETYARRGNLINVGVDVRGFRPVTLAELLA